MQVHVGNNLYVNPDKVEMVFLNETNPDGTPHEPFVVLGFPGGTGRSLPPSYTLDHVIKALNEAENPSMVYNFSQNNIPPKALALFVAGLVLGIVAIVLGILSILS